MPSLIISLSTAIFLFCNLVNIYSGYKFSAMASKFIGYDNLNRINYTLKSLTDTQLHFYDLRNLHRRLWADPIHPIINKLKESGLVEMPVFQFSGSLCTKIWQWEQNRDWSLTWKNLPSHYVLNSTSGGLNLEWWVVLLWWLELDTHCKEGGK